jgi:hypothetical protein
MEYTGTGNYQKQNVDGGNAAMRQRTQAHGINIEEPGGLLRCRDGCAMDGWRWRGSACLGGMAIYGVLYLP